MERVAFLIEETNERIGCLLNPESLLLRRTAGVQPRRSATGQLTGAGLTDDPLLYTGGGRTELELDLLFDVSLAGSSVRTNDVRDLTDPLWRLAENAERPHNYGQPPLVRFIWGKSWNIPGVISAVAGRLEHFTPEGVPRRSWLSMRLLRVDESERTSRAAKAGQPTSALSRTQSVLEEGVKIPPDRVRTHAVIGGGLSGERGSGERLDQIAFRSYGNPAHWRLIAAFNAIADPLRLLPGQLLRIPLLPIPLPPIPGMPPRRPAR